MNIYLSYIQTRSGGYPLSDEEYSDREPGHVNFRPRGLFTKEGYSQETINVDFNPGDFIGKPLYVVYVLYTTGDTFGYTTGEWHIVGVFTDIEKAREVAQKIHDGTFGHYQPWQGYFEQLESVKIWETPLINAKCPGISLAD